MRIILVCVLLILLLAGFASADKRILLHGPDVEKLKALGCNELKELPTAHVMKCPDKADTSDFDVAEDFQVFAADLKADVQIRADQVWTMGFTGSGRQVAVLDTGIDYNHPELKDNYVVGGFDYVNDDNNPFDDNGHGTHVAGIITAKGVKASAKGVAPDAGIIAYKILDASGSGYLSDIILAIDAASLTGADAISMSLGTQQTWKKSNCDSAAPDFTAAVNRAVSKGKVVVAAAGNSQSGVSLPGCISSVIVVGAVNNRDSLASFSGRGFAMADHGVVAPGVSIYSSVPGNRYAYYSGTSMATPHVAALVALMRSKNPGLSVDDVKTILWTTSKDLGIKGFDTSYGHGRIDALAAVMAS
jgi:subtilisin family serine protease